MGSANLSTSFQEFELGANRTLRWVGASSTFKARVEAGASEGATSGAFVSRIKGATGSEPIPNNVSPYLRLVVEAGALGSGVVWVEGDDLVAAPLPAVPVELAALGATGTVNTPLVSGQVGLELSRIAIVSSAGLTANDTNYRTLVIQEVGSGGGVAATLGYRSTRTTAVEGGTGDWTAEIPMLLWSGSHKLAAANNYVRIVWAHTASGIAIPASTIFTQTR